nr:respiratory nitrate reductase subunit gamma [Candidatus Sodalis pierantonius]
MSPEQLIGYVGICSILEIFFGHLLGLLTPHWVYQPFLSIAVKQQMAMAAGGVFRIMTLIGGLLLLKRRLTHPRHHPP